MIQEPRDIATNPTPARLAEQLYTAADLSRLLKVPPRRIKSLIEGGELPAPALRVPLGGHKGRRWTASQFHEIFARWAA